jgi:hypothetical protein
MKTSIVSGYLVQVVENRSSSVQVIEIRSLSVQVK